MANVDVISLIFESYELIRARYKEVLFPLAVLLLFSGAGNFGGSSLSDMMNPGSRSAYPGASPLASAMQDPSVAYAMLGGALLFIIAIVLVAAIILGIISVSIWFYVSEHFNAIIRKQKKSQDWQSRMKRHLGKALVLSIFEYGLLAVFAGCLLALILLYPAIGPIAVVLLALLLLAVALVVMFFLIPAWAYYAMDCLPFFESLRRSIALVRSNWVHFAVFVIIFAMIGMGAGLVSLYSVLCCISFLVTPIMIVFFTLLSRVTLLKMKAAMEKAPDEEK